MSNYGSNPGPPQEPWGRQQQPPQEPYGQPSDPWGGQPDPWGGTPASTPPAGPASPAGYPGQDQGGYDRGGYQQPGYQPGYQQGGYEQSPGYGATRQYEQPGYPPMPSTEPVWGQPVPPPPRKRGNRALVLVVVALALLVVAGGIAAVIKLGGADDNSNQGGGAPPTSTQEADPSAGPDESQEPSPAPENSTDARFVKAGQCVVNEGTDQQPKLKIVECAGETYEVLARFDGTIDYEGKCKTVQGYQFHYFFDSELNPLDFVLCLKQR
jgi:hypothetical protein